MGTMLKDTLSTMGDRQIAALLRCAKKKGSGLEPFFTPPKAMMCLRDEAERRGLPPVDGPWRDMIIKKVIDRMEVG